MNILITYFSKTGNTKALAEAISEGVAEAGANPVLKDCAQVSQQDFLDAAGIIAGSPVYFGGMAAELKAVFDRFVGIRKQMENKIGAAFATAGDATGGKETTLFSILQAMLIYGMIIVGDPLDATGHYGTACEGRPSSKALENAKKLGARVARLAQKLNS